MDFDSSDLNLLNKEELGSFVSKKVSAKAQHYTWQDCSSSFLFVYSLVLPVEQLAFVQLEKKRR